MTPRERVLSALQHREPDRIPVDLGGTESSGMTAVPYNRLRTHLGLPPGATQVVDVYQQVARIEPDLVACLELDTAPIFLEPLEWRPFILTDGSSCQIPRKWDPHRQEDGSYTVSGADGLPIARMPAKGYYFEPVHAPLCNVSRAEELAAHARAIESFDWPSYADEDLASVEARARRLFTETDLALVANLQLHLLAAGQILRGYENFMVDLLVNKPLAHALLGMLTDAYIQRTEAYFARLAPYVQVVLVNDDLGTQNGPMLSLDCYKEMILPYQQRLFRFVKEKSGAHLLFHSCGAVSDFIPSLIAAGVDALNPIQVAAAGMDTRELKHTFGTELTFWGGGCDTQYVLPRGTPQQIEDEVTRRVDDLAPGGGFVFTQVHNIQPDVPPHNVMTMYRAARDNDEE